VPTSTNLEKRAFSCAKEQSRGTFKMKKAKKTINSHETPFVKTGRGKKTKAKKA